MSSHAMRGTREHSHAEPCRIPPEGYDARRLCAVGLPGGAGRGAEQGRQLPTDIPLSRPRSRQRDRGRVGRSVGAAQQYLETLWRGLGAVLRSGAGTRQQLSAGPLRRSGVVAGRSGAARGVRSGGDAFRGTVSSDVSLQTGQSVFSTSAPRRQKSPPMCARSWLRSKPRPTALSKCWPRSCRRCARSPIPKR